MNLKSSSILLTLLLISLSVLSTFNDTLGQENHGMSPAPPQSCCQGDGHGGSAGCCQNMGEPGSMMPHMEQMLSHMAGNPEMLKSHFSTMITHPDVRAALISLLKQNAEFRRTFEKLLSDSK